MNNVGAGAGDMAAGKAPVKVSGRSGEDQQVWG